ncbi:MAG: hydrogenase formation protein HypD [Planctomycetes bacterium]|nr:hydrogenase formation protein HypD [Planctomycetota bacterium]
MPVKTLTIDGQLITSPKDQTLLDAARAHGVKIPTLCHLDGVSDVGACRLCLVEIAGSNKLVPSCLTQVAEGMVVTTNSARLLEYRRMIVELLFAVGFETTAPATALAVRRARQLGLRNFSMLVSHVLVPPAMEMILASPGNRVQGFLAAGHVCTVMGYEMYDELAARFRVPIVVTGFEPIDLLEGLLMLVEQLEAKTFRVENQYVRSVQREGNRHAQAAIAEVYEVCDRAWRGLGVLSRSGLRLRPDYQDMDADRRFPASTTASVEPRECRSAVVLLGLLRPDACEAFGTRCTPEHPLGAPMVSSEGACAAYYRYSRPAKPRGERSETLGS